MSAPLLQTDGATVTFSRRRGGKREQLQAVVDASLAIEEGETVGLVGESGSGKSTLGLAAIGLQKLTAGTARFAGEPMPPKGTDAWRRLRRRVQIVFQDPFSALNPRQTIAQSLGEPLRIHGHVPSSERGGHIARLLDEVGLPPEVMDQYPGALSGGQRQRVCIARALAVEPDLIVCDEITSALDVSTQAQIVALLKALQDRTGVALLFISHDLGLMRAIADRVAVMYLGQIVEEGGAQTLFETPRHPYTRALLAAAPVPDPQIEATRQRTPLAGEVPDPANPPSGCPFRTRCPHADTQCERQVPPHEKIGSGGRVSCHHWRRIETELEPV